VCFNVTGGNIAVQGYWMPFDSAKYMCMTFCWEIRHALTPIFGPQFIRQCIRPGQPGYKTFQVPPNVIEYGRSEQEKWKNNASTALRASQNAKGAITEVEDSVTAPTKRVLRSSKSTTPTSVAQSDGMYQRNALH